MPVKINPVGPNGPSSSSGIVAVNTSTFTVGTVFNVFQQNSVAFALSVGAAGALTDLLVSVYAIPPETGGKPVPMLSGTGGDFATVSDFLKKTTTNPHTTAAGGTALFELGLDGCYAAVLIQAKGNSTTLQIDANGDRY